MNTPDEVGILKQNHKQWLELPQTKSLLLIVTKHEESLSDRIASASMNKDTTADYVRLLAAQLATVKTLSKVVSDTETFIHNCSKQQ